MLATLLPGLRDIRIPLASGLIWLAFLGVSLSWLIPLISPTLLVKQFVSAGGLLGGAALLTVLSFIAYLVGLVVLGLPVFAEPAKNRQQLSPTSYRGIQQRVLRDIRGARERGVSAERLASELSQIAYRNPGYESDDEAERRHRDRESLTDPELWTFAQRSDTLESVATAVLEELDLAELSLQMTSRDVYDKYDRLRAEGEFRRAVAPALAALSIAVAARCGFEFTSPWPLVALVGLLPAWLLWQSGGQRLIGARDFMVQAILAGQAVSPTLKLITDLEAPGRVL